MRIFAPAKLNIFLKVIGRRPDGYHIIRSGITFIDLYVFTIIILIVITIRVISFIYFCLYVFVFVFYSVRNCFLYYLFIF